MWRLFSPKRVVYTSLFGFYEPLNEQKCPNATNIRFICFTDRDDLKSDTWEIRRIETIGIDKARESRRPKLLPHTYLHGYDESLYIDNSVSLKCDPSSLFDSLLPKHSPGFVCIRHPWRRCAYDEAEVIIRGLYDDEHRVREQMDAYQDTGFPKLAGLIAGGFILRRHHERNVRCFDEKWFSHILRYSKRDQLSFSYLAWRYHFSFKMLDFQLDANPFFQWPYREQRIPRGFDPKEYLWLNADIEKAGLDPYQHMFEHGYREKRRFRYRKPLLLDTLANKYHTDKGSLYYNRHFYTRIYDHYLSPMRKEQFTLLEIGLLRHDVQPAFDGNSFEEAPSLFMWDEYFEQAEIHGINIADFSKAVRGKITFTMADQSNIEELSKAVLRSRYKIKVIIDDGSHASHHQQTSFSFLFKHLASNGFYFIEDLGFQPRHLEKADAPKTRDLLSAIQRGERPHSPYIVDKDMDYLMAEIAEVRFFDSMDYMSGPNSADSLALIRKRQATV